MTRFLFLLVCSVSLFHNAAFAQNAKTADTILHNGLVWTVNEKQPQAEAIAIRDGKIVAVGSSRDVLKLKGNATKVIDLNGAYVQPGFNDTHIHFASAARFLEFNIKATSKQTEFVDRIQHLVKTLPKNDWILGGFWGAYDKWALGSSGTEKRKPFVPNIKQIEHLSENHPIFIQKFDNSAFAANRKAMLLAGLNPDNPQAADVEFLKDDAGKPTGIMTGKGVRELFRKVIPRNFSYQRRINQTKKALQLIAEHGVTNVSDMSDDTQLKIYRDLRRKNELTTRIHFRYPLDRWKELAERGIKTGSGDDWIRLGSLKGHIDGIMGTSSARFFDPYTNNLSNRGRWRKLMTDNRGQFVPGQFLKYMLDADKAGLQITVHAIGDEANHLLMNYLEELDKKNGKRDRRFRLVHAQVIAENDFRRLAKLGIIAEVQPFHLSDDMRWMELRIGHKRCEGAYAFKRIQESGAMLAFGTDWPGTSAAEYPINPMLGLYAAVTRQTVKGEPAGGWFPNERISIKQAIKAYTYNSAYANFEEKSKGTLEVGKVADVVVLSQNLLKIKPKQILKTKVLYTFVDGKIVFERD